MSVAGRSITEADIPSPLERLGQSLQMPAVVAVAYFIGAEAAFVVGTLSDRIFAPFWPPNVILLCALLFAPRSRWWIFILVVFPAHFIAELQVGMPLPQNLVAFATNCTVAILGAIGILRLLGDPPRLDTLRRAALYVFVAAFAAPAAVALGGAFVPILGGGAVENYWTFWTQWYLSNALGALALGPLGITLLAERTKLLALPLSRVLEASALSIALVLVCTFVFSGGAVAPGFVPAMLYLPLPFVLWAAIRFGTAGASTSVLLVAIVLIWRTLNGPSLFIAGDVETNVFAMQAFLLGLAVPALLLSAASEETQKAAEAIRESEERLAFAAASASVCLWHFDYESDQFWMTNYGRRMFGFAPNEPISRYRLLKAVHPDDRHSVIFSAQSLQPDDLFDTEFRISQDGEERWIRSRGRLHRSENGRIGEISGTFVDFTDRKAADNEAAQQSRELAHMMRVSMLGQLSGGLAHELTQPLTAILSNAQAARLMLDSPKPDLRELAEVLDDIITEDNRAGEVIHRLRGLLKKDAAKLEPVNVNDLMQSTLRLLHSEMIGRRITVNTDFDNLLPEIAGDAVQLQQVILNLLMNAADAVNEASSSRHIIAVTTTFVADEKIRVEVADWGTGLAASLQEHSFQPFFTTKDGGLGLGLSISSSIIKMHGGELQLENNPEGGAIAWFTLPVHGANTGASIAGRAL